MTHMMEGPKGGLHNHPVSSWSRTQFFLEIIVKKFTCNKAFMNNEDFTDGFIGETEDVTYMADARALH